MPFSHREVDAFSEYNLVEIVEKSTVLIEHHLEMNNIKLIKEFDIDSLVLTCNPQKLQQALLSLFINAIQAMSSKGGNLKVSLTRDSENAIIRVIDTGSGIADRDLPFIFETFFTTKDKLSGTGLGMAVVYGIVNSHKGSIVVENTSVMGTTFKIKIPIKK